MTTHSQMPVQSGDRAPDFVVPAVHEERTIMRHSECPEIGRSLTHIAVTREQYEDSAV